MIALLLCSASTAFMYPLGVIQNVYFICHLIISSEFSLLRVKTILIPTCRNIDIVRGQNKSVLVAPFSTLAFKQHQHISHTEETPGRPRIARLLSTGFPSVLAAE